MEIKKEDKMPLYDRSQAKKGGWQQVREALVAFKGTVVKAEDGQWGGKLVDEEGNPLPTKDFFEVETTDNEVLESKGKLEMDISERFSFRVNMSDSEGSFWVDKFLTSADNNKVLLPGGLLNKEVTFKKDSMTWDIGGRKITYTNFVIAKVADKSTTKAIPKVVNKPSITKTTDQDPMAIARVLAVGKTEEQFRMAAAISSTLPGPYKALAKAGALTATFLEEGSLIKVEEGGKEIYKLPES